MCRTLACLACLLIAPTALAQEGGGGSSGGDSSGGDGVGSSSDSTASASTASGSTGSTSGSSSGGGGQQGYDAPPPRPAGTSHNERRLREEEEGDGRDADLLWIEALFGYSYIDLVQFDNSNFLPDIDRHQGNGYVAGGAAGFRISFLMIGARGTLASYEGFDLATVGLDVHLRIPLPVIEPYFRVGAGYAWVGAANYDVPDQSDVSIFGLAIDAGAGIDVYLDEIFAIGVGMDGVFLNLSRQRVDMDGCGSMDSDIGTVNFQEDGDAAGLQLRAHAHASLHF